tara:strand:- start:7919 stop:8605 length:687 start_codon:yes stop_codon:yes gene_type:complete
MRHISPILIALAIGLSNSLAGEQTLFSGKNLKAWEFPERAWYINDSGEMACRMTKVKDRKGRERTRGMGYIWSKKQYSDFVLTLSYKLSEGANSGVFYRTDKTNPVQGGFEVQLMDNEGFQKTHGKKEGKKLNGSFYDAKAPSSDPSKPAGQWNDFKLTCNGSNIRIAINGVEVINVDVDDWDTAGKNPDGTANKFKTALKDLPRNGYIGMQNHGQYVWFKNVKIKPL